MRTMIAVVGSDVDDVHLSQAALALAEEIGRGIARRGGVLVCGGRGGVMLAACRGAKAEGGTTVGILPEQKEEANEFIDIPIPTGFGLRRNILVANAADAVIAVAGRWGTLSEVSFAMIFGKPVVLVQGTGGCVDELAEGSLMRETQRSCTIAHSAQDAVEKAFGLCNR